MVTRKSRKSKSAIEAIPFSLRLPPDIHGCLSEIAEREGKSLNSLMVELLAEKVDSLRIVSDMAEKDPLAAAWYAAESAELFSRSIRGAITRFRNMDEAAHLDIPAFLNESTVHEHEINEPISQLTPFQRELLDEFSKLSPEKQSALKTIITTEGK